MKRYRKVLGRDHVPGLKEKCDRCGSDEIEMHIHETSHAVQIGNYICKKCGHVGVGITNET